MAKKYLSLERLTEYDELIKLKIDTGDASTLDSAKSYADGLVGGKSDIGHNHDDRYYTETEIDTKLLTVNTSISNITSGTTVVKEAEHATSADSATSADNAIKATKDASGNAITETYETKTDAVTKLEEAKTYTDTAISSITTITFDEIDEICGAVTEGSLLETDVDELMAQLED